MKTFLRLIFCCLVCAPVLVLQSCSGEEPEDKLKAPIDNSAPEAKDGKSLGTVTDAPPPGMKPSNK